MIQIQVAESLLPDGVSPEDEPQLLGTILPFDLHLLVQAAEETLRQQGAEGESELTILISDDDHLQELNRQFLGIDAPTDVLSFPAGDGETDPDAGVPYLGDIVISLATAQAQAAAGDHSLASEMQLLVVHGVLHLLGHDHAEEEEKAIMWAAQAEVLQSLGVDDLSITG